MWTFIWLLLSVPLILGQTVRVLETVEPESSWWSYHRFESFRRTRPESWRTFVAGGTPFATFDREAFAEFNFTGTSLAYYAEYWPADYSVATGLRVDGDLTVIDLRDTSNLRLDVQPPVQELFRISGLDNVLHTVRVEFPPGNWTANIVGRFSFTHLLDESSESSSPTPTPNPPTASSTSELSQTASLGIDTTQTEVSPEATEDSSIAATPPQEEQSTGSLSTPAIVGIALGFAISILLVVAIILLLRHVKRQKEGPPPGTVRIKHSPRIDIDNPLTCTSSPRQLPLYYEQRQPDRQPHHAWASPSLTSFSQASSGSRDFGTSLSSRDMISHHSTQKDEDIDQPPPYSYPKHPHLLAGISDVPPLPPLHDDKKPLRPPLNVYNP
ncbi:hypothetical protein FA15DRAFT_691958 [Coprinopsis marcescibilis]|uniref:Mid2 domain-containing protein n=1 Tax=Coprinopsis marcescibilis TaxID=230819 RepID=A0A5C3L5M6_COPMA|nr:hypothetical protein FA15DRAFT_691958 [Coprinopsis marcescibilis]